MSDDTTEIAALRIAAKNAAADRYKIERERDSERRDLIAQARQQIDETISAKYDADFQITLTAENEARQKLDTALIAHSLSENKLTGELLYEWKNVTRHGMRSVQYKLTGRCGRLEVCTQESKFPANITYDLPALGEVFLRVLKKDGTPSSRYEKKSAIGAGHYAWTYWLPTGQEPPK